MTTHSQRPVVGTQQDMATTTPSSWPAVKKQGNHIHVTPPRTIAVKANYGDFSDPAEAQLAMESGAFGSETDASHGLLLS
jgi:hypothetical protein